MSNPADDISQAEKRRIMADERRAKATYHSHAQATIDEDRGGRFALSGNPATVVGSAAGPVYPQQPATSFSNQFALMPEEPLIDGRGEGDKLGYEIDRPDAAAPDDAAGDGSTLTSGTTAGRPITKFRRRA